MAILHKCPATIVRCMNRISWTAVILVILATPNVMEALESPPARKEEKSSAANTRNRLSSDQGVMMAGDLRAGKELFGIHCATCHGPRGKGDGLEIVGTEVADLTSRATQRKLNVDLLKTIHEGRPEKVMPAWEWRLSRQQSKDVLAYIRTLKR